MPSCALIAKTGVMRLSTVRRAWVIYAALLGLTLLWLLAIIAAPWLMCYGEELKATVLYRGFALVCHQRSARSFHWCSWPLAVCARCTGIYAGAWLGILLYPWWRRLSAPVLPARRYLMLALAPLLVDWIFGALGVTASYAVVRMATGLLAGSVAAFYLLPILLILGDKRAAWG
jgi:uncharacterized membrane protein